MSAHPGRHVFDLMQEIGWNQRDLASVLGVREQVVSRIVNGRAGISARIARLLGAALSVCGMDFLRRQSAHELSLTPAADPGIATRAWEVTARGARPRSMLTRLFPDRGARR